MNRHMEGEFDNDENISEEELSREGELSEDKDDNIGAGVIVGIVNMDELLDPSERIMNPEQIEVLTGLHPTMKTITEPVEIDDYLRALVKAMIMVSPPSYPMDRIFSILMKKVNTFIDFASAFTQIRLLDNIRRHWVNPLYDLMLSSYIRRETIDLNGRLISWSEEEVYSWSDRIMETGQYTVTKNGTEITRFERLAYGRWDDVRWDDDCGTVLNIVMVEEYDDRYVEKYPKWEKYTFRAHDECGVEYKTVAYKIVDINVSTIWKRDLWREELHTIPFKAIHEELLYSPALIGLVENEATKAKKHFEWLRS